MTEWVPASRIKGLFLPSVSQDKPAAPNRADPAQAPGPSIIRIGRGPDNDVVLDYEMVSFHHARIRVSGQEMHIEDLGSSNGTALGHPDNRIQRAPLGKSDVVYFGSLRVPAARLLQGHLLLGRQAHQTVQLGSAESVMGRDPTCDHVLNYPMISWRHARLARSANQLFLEDLGSSNGTFVNGKRIAGKVLVRPGDVISLGTFSFALAEDGQLHKRDFRGNVSLEARNLTVDIPGRRLLENISLVIHPTELVGLMGPSGAGKTTLLHALNGYAAPTHGEVLLNGQNMYGWYRQFAPFIGYVPQDDIIHRDLTVFQALYYSARLRLPADATDEEIETRIRGVLRDLGLEGTENVQIGSPEKRGISGGQRKRVNLAMELLTEPLVLFLDEPTSGLSSQDAEVVMRVLRAIANQGKTILVTIHQPGLEVFRLLDNLVMLARDSRTEEPARLVYYGPAYPDAIAFFNSGQSAIGSSATPEALFQGLGQRPIAEWDTTYRASPYFRAYVVQRARPDGDLPSEAIALEKAPLSFRFQWRTLVRRCFSIKVKDRINSAILLVQAPVVALLIVMVFGKPVGEKITAETWPQVSGALGTTLLLMTLAAVWFGASNAVREIVGEWAIYRRERMVNLSILAYVASKFTVLSTLAVLQCVTLLAIAFPGCHLKSNPLVLLSLLLLAAFLGTTIGLILSAVARTSEVAIALLPIVLLAMVILGGAMQPIHTMPRITQYLSTINPARWCFEGMVVLESGQRPVQPPLGATLPGFSKTKGPSESKDMAEAYFPRATHRASVGTSFAALLLLAVGYASVSPLILRLRDLRSMVVRPDQSSQR